MIAWENRTKEERALFNPAFVSILMWHSARGYAAEGKGPISLEELFLVPPIVLHRATRESLPRTIRTSLTVWLEDNPLLRGSIASRVHSLVPYTKEALLFAGVHGMVAFESKRLIANESLRLVVSRTLNQSSDEVQQCAKRAEFIGRWFAASGNPMTVLTLIGVRP